MTQINNLLIKLKPILGEQRVRKLFLAYQFEPSVRRDIEIIVTALVAKYLNETYSSDQILLPPPEKDVCYGEYELGEVIYGSTPYGTFGLREEEFIQHVCIFGRSGSGKSNIAYLLVDRFFQKGIPFMVFDWKKTYRDLVPKYDDKNILVFTVGREVAPFYFNPLIPPPGIEKSVWAPKLAEILCHSFFAGEGVAYLLLKSLHHVYEQADTPTFQDVKAYLETYKPKRREALWFDSTWRIVHAVCFEGFGRTLNNRNSFPLQELLTQNVLLELEALTYAQKTFFTEAILLWIHHFRMQQPHREVFQHALVVEEAHHLLLQKAHELTGKETITDVILREIREFGESIILLDQHPSLISRPALGNTYTTIALNLKGGKDADVLSECLSLEYNQKIFLGKLLLGQGIVKLQGRGGPFLVSFPQFFINKASVTDDMVKERMRSYYEQFSIPLGDSTPKEEIRTQERTEKEKPPISENEKIFLQDIIEHPFSGLVERYRRLELNVYQGNKLRDTLIQKEFIETVNIPTQNGRLKVLQLTEKAKEILNLPPQERRGGVHHEYYKEQAAEHFRKRGYIVIKEYPIGAGKTVDVAAMSEDEKIAIEVETGKSDHIYNVQKCLPHFDKIISLVLDEKTKTELRSAFQDNPKVQILSPREFFASD